MGLKQPTQEVFAAVEGKKEHSLYDNPVKNMCVFCKTVLCREIDHI